MFSDIAGHALVMDRGDGPYIDFVVGYFKSLQILRGGRVERQISEEPLINVSSIRHDPVG